MKEKLIGRVGRIISGSFNSLISAIEDAVPETVMEEAIGEIDESIGDVRLELGKVVANKHLANSRLMEENRKHEDLSEKIELALSENRDDLAESAISQQLDIEVQIPVLETTINECGSQEKELEGYISALHAKKRQMKEELSLYRKSLEEAENIAASSEKELPNVSGSVEKKVAKAESVFERVMEKATGIPLSQQSINRKDAANMSELEDMARKNRIQERLLAIKGKAKDNLR